MEKEKTYTTTDLMEITGLSEKVEEVVEKIDEARLEKLKREHPLVTDERCFILSWFPETIPSGFSEEEEYE